MYIRLINNDYDYQSVVKHAEKLGAGTARKCVEFLATRCDKIHSLIQCLNSIANRDDVAQAPLMQFLRGVQSVVKAEHCSIYVLEDSSYSLVKASTFADIDTAVPLSCIVGGVEIANGESMVNVFNTKSSEYYKESLMKEHYNFDVNCVLSFPIRDHTSKTYGIIEVVNKTSGPPFFDAEDEGMLKTVTNFWNLLIRVPSSELQGKTRTDDIRVLINTASLMSADAEMEDIIKMMNPTARDLISAERAMTWVLEEATQELWSSQSDSAEQLRIPARKGLPGKF
jgi:signal transduction protein with GAF and PtsI domain